MQYQSISSDETSKIEQDFLSNLIQEPGKIKEYSLTSDLFSLEADRSVFEAIYESIDEKGNLIHSKALDILKDLKLDIYFSNLMDNFYSGYDFEYRLDKLQKAAKSRKINSVIQLYESGSIPVEDLITSLTEVNSEVLIKRDEPINVNKIIKQITSSDESLKCPDFNGLFRYLNISKNTLNLIGATSGVGKSSLALNFFSSMLRVKGYYPIYFNLEMSETTVLRRITAINTGIPIREQNSKENQDRLIDFWINKQREGFKADQIQTGSKTVEEIGQIISRAVRNNKDQNRHVVVFIDLLSHIRFSGSRSEREELAEISKALLGMTKDLDCTVFLLQQLNREAYKGEAGQENFKGCGQTVEDSDNALILKNLNKDSKEHERDAFNYFGLKVSKARNGGYGVLYLRCKMDTQRFEVIESISVPEWAR